MSDPTYYILSARGGCQVSSGDDNDTDKYKDKDTDKDKYKDRGLQRLNVCYIFERHGVQGIKFYIGYHLVMTKTQINTKTKTKCFKDPRYVI